MQSLNLSSNVYVDDSFFNTLLDFCPGKVALLEAYFDESGRENGLLCVAGYVFAPPQARKLAKAFRREFGPYGGLHMKNFAHGKKLYEPLGPPERERLMKAAVRIINQRFSYGVAISVNEAEYRALAPRFLRGLRSPYPFLCQMAMTAVAQIAELHGDNAPITYVFEDGHRDAGEAKMLATLMGSTEETRRMYHYHGVAFVPKTDAIPLQAADLLVYEMAKHQHQLLAEDPRPMRQSLRSLLEGHAERYSLAFCGGDSLAESMRKFARLHRDEVEDKKQRAIERERKRELRRGNAKGAQGL